ncbi:hypothetical protein EHS25_003361 [Saitozyma podzolica]|uniref:Nuclease S1 n=1 Tax=Saitozyma podzolica TaxID=1890683 RepID=A0A427Y8N4_9TREE|nr:hypothetical protein EHS25_003361 [Saitozyma podzolica]
MHLLRTLLALVPLLPSTLAWGAAGHEIVATIAQIHLHPSVKEKLCTILPAQAKCHLAPVAAWADQVRTRYPGTGPMHYINANDDHPPEKCSFGEHGWTDEDVNVLTAIMNMTQQVMDGRGDIPLRFLTHFVGDMHQPLHLCGRDKGGNGAMFLWEGHHRNLHSVWDSGILTKKIRELGNYTTPLPSKQIESSLLGAIFDPYVRWIVWEGIRQWWTPDLPSWLSCPADGDPYPHSSNSAIPPSHPLLNQIKAYTHAALSYLPDSLAGYIHNTFPFPSPRCSKINDPAGKRLASEQEQFPACPYTWAKNMHQLNCDVVWPKEYTGEHGQPLIELDTDQYIGKINGDKTIERLMAMAGLRLAKVVNEAVGGSEAAGVYLGYAQ